MAEGPERSSKTEDPSQRRLDESRAKGDVAKSPEVAPALTLAVAAGVLIVGGGAICRDVTMRLLPFIAHPDAFAMGPGGGVNVLHAALTAALPGALVMLAVMVAGVASNVLQSGLIFAPAKLAPDFSKLSPMQGLKRLLGLDNLVSFIKSLTKLTVVALAVWVVLKGRATLLSGLSAVDPLALLPIVADMLKSLVLAVIVASGAMAGFDWFWTRHRFLSRLKMTREEVKQEHKDSDGDPHLKAKLRAMRNERSKRRMIQAVPKATVVVMNPTHYAVALRYVQGETAAPLCVAKGMDTLALKIREIAEANGVPVVEDPPLARALYAATDVDQTIPREHYEAVAKLIGFILSAGRRRAGRSDPGVRGEERPDAGRRMGL